MNTTDVEAQQELTAAPAVQEWTLHYSMVAGVVRLARIHTRRQLTVMRWAGDVDNAALVVSELVTNAIRHGQLPGRELTLRLAVLVARHAALAG
ncbi:hypothetical protein ACFV7R_25535 [Streptomyces sp. NPDC059866]|uniref:hypothetical protein n=1 Tax=Streptomyces sp. NPDC059866 TaxID=3346978 RepID=UPI0036500153